MYINRRVAIIVLDYNRPDLTNSCLESIWAFNRLNVILVNSGSATRESYTPDVPFEYVENRKGRSFSTGMNTGLEVSSKFEPEFIIFMNNDAKVTDKAIEMLVRALEINSGLGMVSSGYQYSLGYMNREKKFREYLSDEPILRFRKKLTGFCLCSRYDLLNMIGGYDENFIFTKEDDDISYRIRKEGYKLAEVLNSKVFHKISSSTDMRNKDHIDFISYSVGWGYGLLVAKRQKNLIPTFFHLTFDNLRLFVKAFIISHSFNVIIFRISLQGFLSAFKGIRR
jgi:GT2 family glycosyltransferase